MKGMKARDEEIVPKGLVFSLREDARLKTRERLGRRHPLGKRQRLPVFVVEEEELGAGCERSHPLGSGRAMMLSIVGAGDVEHAGHTRSLSDVATEGEPRSHPG